jgi:hypothetical protein
MGRPRINPKRHIMNSTTEAAVGGSDQSSVAIITAEGAGKLSLTDAARTLARARQPKEQQQADCSCRSRPAPASSALLLFVIEPPVAQRASSNAQACAATSPAVKATQLPGVEDLFRFVEGEAVVPNRLRHIGLSV